MVTSVGLAVVLNDLAKMGRQMILKSKSADTIDKVGAVCCAIREIGIDLGVENYSILVDHSLGILKGTLPTDNYDIVGTMNGDDFEYLALAAVNRVRRLGKLDGAYGVGLYRRVYKMLLKYIGVDGHNYTIMVDKFNGCLQKA